MLSLAMPMPGAVHRVRPSAISWAVVTGSAAAGQVDRIRAHHGPHRPLRLPAGRSGGRVEHLEPDLLSVGSQATNDPARFRSTTT